MPNRRSTDGSVEDLPVSIRAAFGLDRAWAEHGQCRRETGLIGAAWTCLPGDRIKVGDRRLTGSKLIELAVMVCRNCPVQWDCARYGIRSEAVLGTWGLPYSDLKWLKNQKGWERIVDLAEEHGVPVSVAVPRVRAARAV